MKKTSDKSIKEKYQGLEGGFAAGVRLKMKERDLRHVSEKVPEKSDSEC